MARLPSKMTARNGGESDSAAGEPARWIFPSPSGPPLVQIVSGSLPTTDSPGNWPSPPRGGLNTCYEE
ncbi:hypothetical protein LZ31DRAFT_560583 [Colletotrichum somersetense]|nr:hypothetical protein LZ31DRAFT_560583 [Colletotrichum somersetense]